MALDDADKSFIAKLIAEQQAEAAKAQEAAITKALAAQRSEIEAKIADSAKKADDAAAAAVKAAEDAKTKGGDRSTNTDGAKSPEMIKLEARLQEQEQKFEGERRARIESETAREAARVDGEVRDALLAAGVPADRIRHALAYVKTEGVIGVDEKTKAVGFKVKVYGVEELRPGAEAAAQWLKTAEGKVFLPPVDSRGDGSNAGRSTNAAASNAPRKADGSLDLGALRGRLERSLPGALAAGTGADTHLEIPG